MLLFAVNIVLVLCYVATFRLWRGFSQREFAVAIIVRMMAMLIMVGVSGYHYLAISSQTTKLALIATLVVGCIGLVADIIRMFTFTDKNIRESAI